MKEISNNPEIPDGVIKTDLAILDGKFDYDTGQVTKNMKQVHDLDPGIVQEYMDFELQRLWNKAEISLPPDGYNSDRCVLGTILTSPRFFLSYEQYTNLKAVMPNTGHLFDVLIEDMIKFGNKGLLYDIANFDPGVALGRILDAKTDPNTRFEIAEEYFSITGSVYYEDKSGDVELVMNDRYKSAVSNRTYAQENSPFNIDQEVSDQLSRDLSNLKGVIDLKPNELTKPLVRSIVSELAKSVLKCDQGRGLGLSDVQSRTYDLAKSIVRSDYVEKLQESGGSTEDTMPYSGIVFDELDWTSIRTRWPSVWKNWPLSQSWFQGRSDYLFDLHKSNRPSHVESQIDELRTAGIRQLRVDVQPAGILYPSAEELGRDMKRYFWGLQPYSEDTEDILNTDFHVPFFCFVDANKTNKDPIVFSFDESQLEWINNGAGPNSFVGYNPKITQLPVDGKISYLLDFESSSASQDDNLKKFALMMRREFTYPKTTTLSWRYQISTGYDFCQWGSQGEQVADPDAFSSTFQKLWDSDKSDILRLRSDTFASIKTGYSKVTDPNKLVINALLSALGHAGDQDTRVKLASYDPGSSQRTLQIIFDKNGQISSYHARVDSTNLSHYIPDLALTVQQIRDLEHLSFEK